ncbi:MAG TPA: hypothetical protein VL547_22040 [Dinghuibacter sp.]|jgi:hypothetical protein|uniref:hypothetical protein n=1 Tax=Dinghuibacter sp. TaxID=2024697 RepID=UPI002C6E3A10|nr:hypothetical protein [Dinghuibacter sp.]HTJ14742.1 hypothetical protein [Dinghuibacter sp.]
MSIKRLQKALAYAVSVVLALAVLTYITGGVMVRRKVAQAVAQLPPSLKVSYSSLHPLLFQSALVIKNLDIRFAPGDSAHAHHVRIAKVELAGIGFFSWLSSRRLKIKTLLLEDGRVDIDRSLLDSGALPHDLQRPFTEAAIGKILLVNIQVNRGAGFTATGDLEIDSVHIDSTVAFSGISCHISNARYRYPDAYAQLRLSGLDIDSRERTLDIDTVRIVPTVDKLELGKIKGHQEDFVEGDATGIHVGGLDFGELRRAAAAGSHPAGAPHRFVADKVTIKGARVYVFRDRRLPLDTGVKPLPVDYLRRLPVDLRVQKAELGPTTFTYEEHPKDGDKTGYLKIVHFSGHIDHLINHPAPGDPAYMNVVTEGSLMGSGSVEATTRMPLRPGDPYIVNGSFHDLDVTSLNPAAENLGRLHLESGLLNNLSFSFQMTAEKATGQIIGEYHNLVADKLKDVDDKKVDKFKSFFLKHLIIPKDKDHTLPVARRTGKVDYKRDHSRYFSYYLLHSLLVGVKGSFSLGFLLPG